MNEAVIDMRAWRQFAAVAQELHFGRAAQRLHMTQPPLTQGIAALERNLGLRLFDRTQRRVQLTPAGAALLPEVLDLLARAQALPGHARAAAAGELGRLRLAFVSTVGFGLLPQWVRAFRAQCPGVQLELIEATGDVQLDALARGDIDAGLLLHSPDQVPPGLAQLCVAREPLVLALPEGHALAATGTGAALDRNAVLLNKVCSTSGGKQVVAELVKLLDGRQELHLFLERTNGEQNVLIGQRKAKVKK